MELKQDPYAAISLLADYMGASCNQADISFRPVNKSYSNKQFKERCCFHRKKRRSNWNA